MPVTKVFHSLIENPRRELNSLIEKKDMTQILFKAGVVHGHYCPGLALGVVASVEGLHALARLRDIQLSDLLQADGMEELIAIVEMNSCVSDGVQVVTGCTFGNNSLIYHDYGKTAVSLGSRSGRGLRVNVGPEYQEVLNKTVPEYTPLFERVVKNHERDSELLIRFKKASAEASFSLLAQGSLFLTLTEIHMKVPDYASIRESKICTRCGESVIANRGVFKNGEFFCIPCAGASFHSLTGEGITHWRKHESTGI
jgi:formylmethanofuran dehydrogenase subunit E